MLGLDVGGRRIGIARGDTRARLATPLSVLQRRNRDHDMREIRRVLSVEGASVCVVGLPLGMDQQLTAQAKVILAWAKRLRMDSIQIIFVDEAMSSAEGDAIYPASVPNDASAAAVILQRYLDHRALEVVPPL